MSLDEREENLRAFRKRIQNSPNVAKYNPHDLERAELEDWWLESFLNFRDQDIDVASAVFFECLKWRQNFGVYTIGLLELRPVLERSFIYFHGTDMEDNRILWINFKNYVPNEQLNMRLLIFWLERHVTDTENQPIAVFLNFHESTFQTMDIQLIKFLFHTLKYYYPDTMQQIYIFELPLRLSAPWRLICSYLDSNTYSAIINLTTRNISTFIPFKYIPKTVGGEDEFVFTISELARSTGSPLAKLRRFSHPPAIDRKLSNSDKNQLRKRAVKFDINATMDFDDVSIFNRTIDWQCRTFMAVAPKRSLILNYDPKIAPPVANLIIQSMSAWNLYFNIGINSRRQIEIEPEKGVLEPNGRTIVTVRTKNCIKTPRKYKIEVIGTRLREVPDDLDKIDIYREPAEDRVKFFYDCFVNVPLRKPSVSKEQNENTLSQNAKQTPVIEQDLLLKYNQNWKDQKFWPIVILFDVLLALIVLYIYS